MIRALGWSTSPFDPADPGRLCRGRERWIDPWELEAKPVQHERLVVSGASFTDDSAADAQRGVPFAGVTLADVIAAVLPRRPLVAFCEDGHPADIPDGTEGVELYTGHRAGGRSEELLVRWTRAVDGVRELREVIGAAADPRVLGFLWLHPGTTVDDALHQRIFDLVGMSSLDSPPARFNPSALPDLLGVARAVVLVHRDKHGPALAFHAEERLGADARLTALAEDHGALPVPFAIPPMLARWDRALADLRQQWIATRTDEFPVPASDVRPPWAGRRRRFDRAELAEESAAAGRAARGEE
jgi:hypothetical protein